MSEKRKPVFIFMLKKPGNPTQKLELFRASEWGGPTNKYRIRVGGKWFELKRGMYTFYLKYEIRDLLWRSIKKSF